MKENIFKGMVAAAGAAVGLYFKELLAPVAVLVAIYYLFYEKRGVGVLLGCAVSVLYVTAPLSGYVVWNYGGRRGALADKYKYVFYALYPAHLLALGLIAKAIG